MLIYDHENRNHLKGDHLYMETVSYLLVRSNTMTQKKLCILIYIYIFSDVIIIKKLLTFHYR